MRHSTTPRACPNRRERNMLQMRPTAGFQSLNVAKPSRKSSTRCSRNSAKSSWSWWRTGTAAAVFLHGGNGPRPDAPFLARLARNSGVIAPTHPGFGTVELAILARTRVDDFAHIHLELIEPARPRLISCWSGHSIGGWTAAELATKTTSNIDRSCDRAGRDQGRSGRPAGHPDISPCPRRSSDELLYVEPEKWPTRPGTTYGRELLARRPPSADARRRGRSGTVHAQSQARSTGCTGLIGRRCWCAGLQNGPAWFPHEYTAAYAGLDPGRKARDLR